VSLDATNANAVVDLSDEHPKVSERLMVIWMSFFARHYYCSHTRLKPQSRSQITADEVGDARARIDERLAAPHEADRQTPRCAFRDLFWRTSLCFRASDELSFDVAQLRCKLKSAWPFAS
jgi:hypothetical protein